jgi:UDP-glucuronate 4-epimerase
MVVLCCVMLCCAVLCCAVSSSRRGDHVVVVDEMNDYYDLRLKHYNLSILKSSYDSSKLAVYSGDICDDAFLEDVFEREGISHVIHLAARAGVRPSIHDPSLYVRTNVDGTSKLLDLARRYDIQNFVFASSSSVYGGSLKSVLSESDVVSRPVSPYAATKITCELLAFTFHHLYGLNATGLRFFTVYGPRGRPDMAPFKFIDRIARGVPIQQYGDGTTSRDYTYITDIVTGVVLALDTPLGYEILNLGNGRPFELSRFIGIVEEAVGAAAVIELLPDQPGDMDRTCANIDKARALLGYSPQVSFEEGITRTVDWYKFFFSVIFPGGAVGHQVAPDSPLGNPFDGGGMGILGSLDPDLETSSNVVGASCQLRSRRSRLNLQILGDAEDEEEEGEEDSRQLRSSI